MEFQQDLKNSLIQEKKRVVGRTILYPINNMPDIPQYKTDYLILKWIFSSAINLTSVILKREHWDEKD